MKQFLKFFSVFIIFFTFVPLVKANVIESINMDIYIDSEGDAHITEVWETDNSKDTEWYKAYTNLGESTIQDFSVSMDGKNFEPIQKWNVDASFKEKAYKHGFNAIDNGVELCFGKSEKGNHKYTLNYTITNFVVEIEDSQMVYWTLMPANFSTLREDVYIKVYSDFKYDDDLEIWGFGYDDGTAAVGDGYIDMSSQGTLDEDESMVLLVKFPKGTFDLDLTKENDFDYYLDIAEEGATQDDDFDLFGLIPLVIYFITMISMFSSPKGAYATRNKMVKGKQKLPKEVPYQRELPKQKDLFRNYFIANEYELTTNQNDILPAVLLKWLKNNKLKLETTKDEKKDVTTLIIKDNETFDNELETSLYKIFWKASEAGRIDLKKFKKWCNDNYEEIYSWFDRVLIQEKYALHAEGILTRKTTGLSKSFYATDALHQEAIQLAGLKKFLEDFSSMETKEAIEVKLWEEYLMYAQLFGIADKVSEQFKKLYPKEVDLDTLDDFTTLNIVSYSIMRSIVSAHDRAEARARNYNAGGGGRSFGGGGGGSFGGGFGSGGGSR